MESSPIKPAAPIRRRVYFSGHVQGVGFRYTAQRLAARFPVTGYVRNLADGRVEMVVEGRPEDVDQCQNAVAAAMREFIRSTNVEEGPATGEFQSFSILLA
jgi:acylphosphatase